MIVCSFKSSKLTSCARTFGLGEGFDHDPEGNRLHFFGQTSLFNLRSLCRYLSADDHRADSAMRKDLLILRSDHQNVSER